MDSSRNRVAGASVEPPAPPEPQPADTRLLGALLVDLVTFYNGVNMAPVPSDSLWRDAAIRTWLRGHVERKHWGTVLASALAQLVAEGRLAQPLPDRFDLPTETAQTATPAR